MTELHDSPFAQWLSVDTSCDVDVIDASPHDAMRRAQIRQLDQLEGRDTTPASLAPSNQEDRA